MKASVSYVQVTALNVCWKNYIQRKQHEKTGQKTCSILHKVSPGLRECPTTVCKKRTGQHIRGKKTAQKEECVCVHVCVTETNELEFKLEFAFRPKRLHQKTEALSCRPTVAWNGKLGFFVCSLNGWLCVTSHMNVHCVACIPQGRILTDSYRSSNSVSQFLFWFEGCIVEKSSLFI